MSGLNNTGQSTGAVTPPPGTFSTTVIALMVCVPIGVLLLIIVVVCVCVRKGDSGPRAETYEDFSKVDQTVMMRMSMNIIDDGDHVVPPEDINHLNNDLDLNDPIKEVKDSKDTENCQEGYQKLETSGNMLQNSKTENYETKKECVSDDEINTGAETAAPPDGRPMGDNSAEEITLRDKTKTEKEIGNVTKQENDDNVRLVPRPVSKTASGEYFTLKANYIPPPE